MSAAAGLLATVVEALRAIDGLGVYDGPPVQAVAPHAVVEAGPERDWGHKSGAGREMRLAVILRDACERPVRLRRLMGEVEAVVLAIGGPIEGWRLVSLGLVRAIASTERDGRWAGLVEFRARLLAE